MASHVCFRSSAGQTLGLIGASSTPPFADREPQRLGQSAGRVDLAHEPGMGRPGRQEIFLKRGLVRLQRAAGSLRGVDLREQVSVTALQLVEPREASCCVRA